MKALGSALRDTSVERDKTEVKMVSRLNKKKLKQLVNLQKIGMEMAKTRREIAARKAKEGK